MSCNNYISYITNLFLFIDLTVITTNNKHNNILINK